VGPWSPQTMQLQGIWTPPSLRGKGLATLAMSGICDKLLAMSPTLSLYVNDFNSSAIKLYERLGFVTIAEFQTILF
ncbi:MAG: GNAT family N-acetyltransferase, partial [Candidatus Eremiobacteraeota bacterium]|nr:GNAT family N-acetyltransferase [Candidatus Eremiobacteraeota bacterium]